MRLYGIDLLRGIAAFGIVGCHLILAPRTPAAGWLTHFCDMNVAVFGVLAGFFTRASSDGRASHDIIRRLKRLLPTYAVWTLVFLAASATFKIAAHDDLGQYARPSFWTSVVFFGGSAAHLWFLAVLAYTQVFALLLLHRKLPCWASAVIGLSGILLSVSVNGWWGWYFFRLFGFVWIGIAVREIRWGDWRHFGMLTLMGLVAHVVFIGTFPAFVRDLFVAVPLVLFATRLPMPITGGGYRCARFLGATSMGVYLVHPLLTKFGWLVATRLSDAPYGLCVVLLDWVLCWATAFMITAAARRIPNVGRFFS